MSECKKMAFFISCDPDDVMKQAEQSTLRYRQGSIHIGFFVNRYAQTKSN